MRRKGKGSNARDDWTLARQFDWIAQAARRLYSEIRPPILDTPISLP